MTFTTPYVREATIASALKLDANEGPAPDPAALAALRELSPEILRRYPDPAVLEVRLAENYGVDPDEILITAGADDGIDRLLRTLVGSGTLAIPTPAFEMFERGVSNLGGSVLGVPWERGPLPTGALIDANADAVVVVSPNNPTGATVTAEDLRAIRAARPDTPLILDAVYEDFAETPLTPVALKMGCVVLRSYSKSLGLAGLRVGLVLGPREIVDRLRLVAPPYAVAGPGLAVIEALLKADLLEPSARTLDRVKEERIELRQVLETLGFRAVPSEANFVFARGDRSAELARSLAEQGIAIRSFAGRPGLDDALRITCPCDGSDFERLISALERSRG